MEFKREDRYAVFKRTDLAKLHPNLQGQFAEVVDRINKELPERRFVVVESDWPEYEAVWRVIEHRVVARGGSFILGTLKRLDAMEKYDNAGVPFRTRKAIENHVKGEGIPIVSETKTPRLAVMAVAQQVVDALEADRKDGGFDLTAGMFGPAFSALVREWVDTESKLRVAEGPVWIQAFKAQGAQLKVWALLEAVDELLAWYDDRRTIPPRHDLVKRLRIARKDVA